MFFLRHVFPKNPVRFYGHTCSSSVKHLTFMSKNSLLANVGITLYPTLNKLLLTYFYLTI